MSMTGLDVFDSTIQKTNTWLKEIREALHLDEHVGNSPHPEETARRYAYHVLRAVLHQLRDRLTVEEAAQFAAQLPLLVRGIFFEGWDPTDKPLRLRHEEDFLMPIQEELHQIGLTISPQQAARVVFEVLNRHISAGEIADVRAMLPKAIRHLWPEPSAQTA